MPQQIVFQNNLVPEQINLSDRFSNAVAFIISAPFINAEIEIDCYLQIYIPALADEIVRVVNLGTIIEQAVYLNLADTDTLSVIPAELLDTGLSMALAFVPSDNTFIQAAVITKNCSVCEELAIIKQQNEQILNALGIVSPVESNFSQAQFQTFYFLGLL